MKTFVRPFFPVIILLAAIACNQSDQPTFTRPSFSITTEDTLFFNSFVDCNMAEAWIGDTFRIFPGKYGHDTLWGNARDLKYASGLTPGEAFSSDSADFNEPSLPPIAPIGSTNGLHGAVWFETVYQDRNDPTGRTLYALYHNENYPANLPYNPTTGQGYKNEKWPQGLQGPTSPAAVCRIGIMKSTDGGRCWDNKGLLLEDLQPRLILKPHNTSNTFAGGVGDPSAVASGDHLYVFYGEYGFPGVYDPATYTRQQEWGGQCISIARIALKDLDDPTGKAFRWDGKGFNAPWNGVGQPVASLQIPQAEGGGAASSPEGGFHWGPSVSWNEYLQCWVMLMGKVTGPSWAGSSIHISFNPKKDLGVADHAQQWTAPQLLLDRPGYFLWYPSLQPIGSADDLQHKYTSTKLGQRARLYVKYIKPERSIYASAHTIEFKR
ncbi:MAG TPA: hypothetical protein VK907_02205 [Phnomibacter sp.]|nr:hypothetical protein [Phnomibacter sp.]